MPDPDYTTQKPLTSALAHPMQPIGWDGKGVIRFKPNAIVDFMLGELTTRRIFDLNLLTRLVARGKFSVEDQVQLAQLIGYSVSGFGDLFYVPEAIREGADAEAEKLANG